MSAYSLASRLIAGLLLGGLAVAAGVFMDQGMAVVLRDGVVLFAITFLLTDA